MSLFQDQKKTPKEIKMRQHKYYLTFKNTEYSPETLRAKLKRNGKLSHIFL